VLCVGVGRMPGARGEPAGLVNLFPCHLRARVSVWRRRCCADGAIRCGAGLPACRHRGDLSPPIRPVGSPAAWAPLPPAESGFWPPAVFSSPGASDARAAWRHPAWRGRGAAHVLGASPPWGRGLAGTLRCWARRTLPLCRRCSLPARRLAAGGKWQQQALVNGTARGPSCWGARGWGCQRGAWRAQPTETPGSWVLHRAPQTLVIPPRQLALDLPGFGVGKLLRARGPQTPTRVGTPMAG